MREDVVGVFKLFLEKRLGDDFLKKELLFIFSKLFGVGFSVVEKLRELVLSLLRGDLPLFDPRVEVEIDQRVVGGVVGNVV